MSAASRKRSGTRKGSAHPPDRMFAALAGILTVTGLFILASASVAVAQEGFGTPLYYVLRQLSFGVAAGLAAIAVVHLLPIAWLRAAAAPAFFLTVALLILVAVPGIGIGSGGATRWLRLGPATIQPSEIAKVTLPLYLAAWFAARVPSTRRSQRTEQGGERPDETSILPFLAIVGLVGIPLLLQPDLSTFGVLALTALMLSFLSGAPLRIIMAFVGAGAGALIVLIQIAPYRMNRVLGFLNPQLDPLGIGYHVQQSLLAVGSGGIVGRGLGFSREKLFFLPEPMGDSIFAVFAEETGFIGAVALIALFFLFLWRGFSIARRLDDPFMRLLAAGLTGWITIQAFLNIAGNIALAPIVGITLPFISYGSASLAATLCSVGIILKLSRCAKE